jgi:methylated-DNA-[protein]-cysteine S-methyltransferase
METLFYSRYESPMTKLLLGASEKGLLVAEFDRGQLPSAKGAAQWQESREELRPYTAELDEYFAGQRRQFSFHLDLRGTFFQLQCWLALLEIPYGETRTYADIARAIGKPQAFRAVGLANNRNPVAIIVPCHRVIASDGTLCGYGGGLDLKQKLLVLEGARTAHLAA